MQQDNLYVDMISMATDATDQKEMRNICIFLKSVLNFFWQK